MDGAYRDGKKEGWQERDEQALREKLEIARKMKAKGLSAIDITESLGLPLDEIDKL
jgi:predicted transposase YdaD